MKAEGRDLSLKTLRLLIGLGGMVLFALGYLVIRHFGSPPDPEPLVEEQPLAVVEVLEGPDHGEADPDRSVERPWREAVPMGSGTAVVDVAAVLAEADRALEDGRLIEPEDDNALSRYLDILETAPDNEAAAGGVHAVTVTLMKRLNAHLQHREVAAAAGLFPILKSLIPGDAELVAAGLRLEQLEHASALFDLARKDLDEGRLIRPENRNALSRLTRAAELDPDNASITEALSALERTLVDLALAAAREFDFAAADRWIGAAAGIRESSTAVDHARESISQYRSHQIGSATDDARLAMRSSRFSEAERAIESVRSLGAEQNLVASLDEELRLSRIYSIYRPGETFRDGSPLGELSPQMLVVPNGRFIMGAASNDPDRRSFEGPSHPVYFERGFAIAKTETTVAQFSAFVAATGYQTRAETDGRSFVYSELSGRISNSKGIDWRRGYNGRKAKDDDPVVHLSWEDASAYARWLADASGKPYRLPTEAEFEYVLRGGRETRYWWGNDGPTEVVENLTGALDEGHNERIWSNAFAKYGDGYWGPAPVGSFQPNPYGVFDLAGNVQEWVLDCWHDSYARAPNDGSAWVNRGCDRRVARGGFWGGPPATARVTHRVSLSPDRHDGSLGFRVARDLVVIPPQIAANQE